MSRQRPQAGMTKGEVIRASAELDVRRQRQIARQIDSINRLLGVDPEAKGNTEKLYAAEITNLNYTIADQDAVIERQANLLRRIRQMAVDTSESSTLVDPRRVLAMLNELDDENG